MHYIETLPFLQLRNAEHVAFFNNVVLELDNHGATDLGLTAEKLTQFKTTVNAEQDIVLKSQGSMYTKDMEAYDEERDNIYRAIRHKLQAVTYAPKDSPLAVHKTALEMYILNKYSTDIVSLAYQEESAHLSGFLMDMNERFSEAELTAMGVTDDLAALKQANDSFSEYYNQRAIERAGSTAELTKKLRGETEELYNFVRLHLEYTANAKAESDEGVVCAGVIGVINEYVKDARQHLAMRQGREE